MVSGSVCAKVVLIMVFLHTPDNDRKLVPHEFSQSPLLLLYEFYEIFCAHLFFKTNCIFAADLQRIHSLVLPPVPGCSMRNPAFLFHVIDETHP